MRYSSERTTALITPVSYLINRAVDAIPDESFLGKVAQHGLYGASYFNFIDKFIQMVAFPILRVSHPGVEMFSDPTPRNVVLFLPRVFLAEIHILYYGIKKIIGIAIGLTGLPMVSKMILGRKTADIYFSYRLIQQFCGVPAKLRVFNVFKPHVPETFGVNQFAGYHQICDALDPFSQIILRLRTMGLFIIPG